MRLRNKKWTTKYISDHQQWMIIPEKNQKINLKEVFHNANIEYALEIGCGKGDFIIQKALKNPNINFVAMEKEESVIGVALRKAVETKPASPINNLRFLNDFAEDLTNFFADDSFNVIYLNFSDPWPKTKHSKKRLTYHEFLNQYTRLITSIGKIELKTDNDDLFRFSVEEIDHNDKFDIVYQTFNLYKDLDELKDNIPTEYETKFHNLNKNINKLIAKNQK